VGCGSVLALDLHFAPAAISAELVLDAAVPISTGDLAIPDARPPLAARVVIPAPARVPTIVARFDRASKEASDEIAIRALATAMIEDHDVTIVLEGHSDTRGGDDFNHAISLERANWVKARLVALGVSEDRIETVGLGATRPLRSDDPDGPSVNRRVEVRWLGSAAGEAPPPKTAKSAPPPTPKESAAPKASVGTAPRAETASGEKQRPTDASPPSAKVDRASGDASMTSNDGAPSGESAPPRESRSAGEESLPAEGPQPGEL
jgi:hypothetical protein